MKVGSVLNLRDVGGCATRDGRVVRSGLVYRSMALHGVRDADRDAFDALGLRTVFDLRTTLERTAMPDVPIDGIRPVVLDVFAGEQWVDPVRLAEVLTNPPAAREVLGNGNGRAHYEQVYRELVTRASARAAYAALFRALAQPDALPALVHCTTGKDRTGWAVAALLALLGVDDDDVLHDYLRSNDELLPGFSAVFDAFADAGGDTDGLRAVIGVRPEYLAAAQAEMHERFGSVERYFAVGLGVDADARDALVDALVTER